MSDNLIPTPKLEMQGTVTSLSGKAVPVGSGPPNEADPATGTGPDKSGRTEPLSPQPGETVTHGGQTVTDQPSGANRTTSETGTRVRK